MKEVFTFKRIAIVLFAFMPLFIYLAISAYDSVFMVRQNTLKAGFTKAPLLISQIDFERDNSGPGQSFLDQKSEILNQFKSLLFSSGAQYDPNGIVLSLKIDIWFWTETNCLNYVNVSVYSKNGTKILGSNKQFLINDTNYQTCVHLPQEKTHQLIEELVLDLINQNNAQSVSK